VCCQVQVSATDWSLVQRSPTDCGASLCVIKKPRKRGGYSPARGLQNTNPQWVVAPGEKIQPLFESQSNYFSKLRILAWTENKNSAVSKFRGPCFKPVLFTIVVSCHTTLLRRTNGRNLATSYVGHAHFSPQMKVYLAQKAIVIAHSANFVISIPPPRTSPR